MMTSLFYYGLSVIFLTTALLKNRQSLLGLLLTLESILLISICIYSIGVNELPIIIILIILSMAACESSLALSVLSTVIRLTGSDKVKSLPL